jgi:hypothetical protein
MHGYLHHVYVEKISRLTREVRQLTPHSVVAKRTADRTAKINDAISEANDSPDHDCD